MVETYTKIIIFIAVILGFIFYLSINSWSSYYQLNIYIQNYSNPSVRVYCIILTVPKYFDTRARAVNSTWAPRCDKYSFISEFSNDTKGLPIASIENIIPGHKHLTQKTTLAFHYVYKNFLNDFDWFIKADDDTYLFVENLKAFLKQQNTSLPITFGYNFKANVSNIYHSGGGGYVLSKEALKRFYIEHRKSNTTCAKDGGDEAVEIAKCLRKSGVYPGKSIDKYNRERFHSRSFFDHFIGPIPASLSNLAENKPVLGPNCCSSATISFHHVTPEYQYLIDKTHYGFHRKR